MILSRQIMNTLCVCVCVCVCVMLKMLLCLLQILIRIYLFMYNTESHGLITATNLPSSHCSGFLTLFSSYYQRT